MIFNHKRNYCKILFVLAAASGIAANLALCSGATAYAGTVSAQTVMKVPASAKKAKIFKRAKIYNKKGYRIGRKTLKKSKRITVYGIKKIHNKKYYSLGHGKYVLVSKIKLLKVKSNVPVANENNDSNITKPRPKQKRKTIKDFSLAEFRQEFLKDLNEERTKRGLAPVVEDSFYDDVVQKRSALLPKNFSHVDEDDNFILQDYFDQAGITYESISECIAMDPWGWFIDKDAELQPSTNGGSSSEVADVAIFEYIYNDADSNWGHRDILLNPDDATIGVGATTGKDGYIFSSVGVTY